MHGQDDARATGAFMLDEASRGYAERKLAEGHTLTADDVEPIARLAMAEEDQLIADRAPEFVIHDTDLISTVVYARHYYGACPDWIETEAIRRRGDLYLLCAPDIPWVADGIRDQPRSRERMHALFVATLGEFDARVVDISVVKPETVSYAINRAFELESAA
jgi:nicotinamide riboside kinase